MPDDLVIGFNPGLAAQRVALRARRIKTRLAGLGVTLVVCVWIVIWRSWSMTGPMALILFAVGLGYSLVWLMAAVIAWAVAKSALAAIPPTPAARIDRQGIGLGGVFLVWPMVAQIVARSRFWTMSPRMRVTDTAGQRYQLNLAGLDVMPATIDASIRAFSGGRFHLDVSRLGH